MRSEPAARELRLLVRDVILLPADAFRHQSAVRLELKPEVQAFIHQRAHRHGLIQVDWHSHPGSGQSLGFSATDDAFEQQQAAYLAHRMDRVPYGSVVVNDDALDGRLWVTQVTQRERTKSSRKPATLTYRPQSQPLQAVLMGDLQRRIPVSAGLTQLDRPSCRPSTTARCGPSAKNSSARWPACGWASSAWAGWAARWPSTWRGWVSGTGCWSIPTWWS